MIFPNEMLVRVISGQLSIDMARVLSEADRDLIQQEQAGRGTAPNNITIDNDATHTQMRYLALVYNHSGHERFKESFMRGVDYLLEAQYDNGGWPHIAYFCNHTGFSASNVHGISSDIVG